MPYTCKPLLDGQLTTALVPTLVSLCSLLRLEKHFGASFVLSS